MTTSVSSLRDTDVINGRERERASERETESWREIAKSRGVIVHHERIRGSLLADRHLMQNEGAGVVPARGSSSMLFPAF